MNEQREGIFFTVNETLYFENGQEIDEMLAISLDPDITLQMYEQYIQIRGIVMLQGEYRKHDQNVEGHNNREENAVYIEKVIDKNVREAKFSHRFPLDISIPNERVANMNDIEVTIDAFDYELPDIQTMKIEATLHIQGVKDKDPEAEVPVEEVEETAEAVEDNSPEPSEEPVKAERTQQDSEPEVTEEIEAAESEVVESDVIEPIEEPEKQTQLVPEESKEIDIQLSETEASEEEEDAVKDVQFLTDLFGGEEEETKTMIKLYIIQEEDTIESIAKKYEIPTLELMKDNQLTGDDISEGQLIHIPVSK